MALVSETRLKGLFEILESFKNTTVGAKGPPNDRWSFSGSSDDLEIVDTGNGNNGLRILGATTDPVFNIGFFQESATRVYTIKYRHQIANRWRWNFEYFLGGSFYVEIRESTDRSVIINGIDTGAVSIDGDNVIELILSEDNISFYLNNEYFVGPSGDFINLGPVNKITFENIPVGISAGFKIIDYINLETPNRGMEIRRFQETDTVTTGPNEKPIPYGEIIAHRTTGEYFFYVEDLGLVSTTFKDPLNYNIINSTSTMCVGSIWGNPVNFFPETGGSQIFLCHKRVEAGGSTTFSFYLKTSTNPITSTANLVISGSWKMVDIFMFGTIAGPNVATYAVIVYEGTILRKYNYSVATNTFTFQYDFDIEQDTGDSIIGFGGGFFNGFFYYLTIGLEKITPVPDIDTLFIRLDVLGPNNAIVSTILSTIVNPETPVFVEGQHNNILIDRRNPTEFIDAFGVPPVGQGIAYICLLDFSSLKYSIYKTEDGGNNWVITTFEDIDGLVYFPPDKFNSPEKYQKFAWDDEDGELLYYTDGKRQFALQEPIDLSGKSFNNILLIPKVRETRIFAVSDDPSPVVTLYEEILDETITDQIVIANLTKWIGSRPSNVFLHTNPNTILYEGGEALTIHDATGNIAFKGRIEYPQIPTTGNRITYEAVGLDKEAYSKVYLNVQSKITSGEYLKTIIDTKLKNIFWTGIGIPALGSSAGSSIRSGDFTTQYKRKIQNPFTNIIDFVKDFENMALYFTGEPILWARPRDELIWSGRVWNEDNPRLTILRLESLNSEITHSEVNGASNNKGQVRVNYVGDPDKAERRREVRITKSDSQILNRTECAQYAQNRFKIYANSDNPPGNTKPHIWVKMRAEKFGYVQVGQTIILSWNDGFRIIPLDYYVVVGYDSWDMVRDIASIWLTNNIAIPKDIKSVNRSVKRDDDLVSTFIDGEAEPETDGLEMDQEPINDIKAVPPGGRVPKSNVLTTAPGATQDIDAGYNINDTVVNSTTETAYICVDNAAGAAVWKQITP
jgi:hypothetical protein